MNWKKRNQKSKRKDKRKKPDPIRDARRFIEAGASLERLSYCDKHGIYSPDLLCACFDKGGVYEGMDYDAVASRADMTTIKVGHCPIHGSYTEDELCACHDENGNLKKDWNKGSSPVSMSFCPEHGPYTPDNLCACYKEGETLDYSTMNWERGPAVCPIHGLYAEEDLCACYDESGKLKKDWKKGRERTDFNE